MSNSCACESINESHQKEDITPIKYMMSVLEDNNTSKETRELLEEYLAPYTCKVQCSFCGKIFIKVYGDADYRKKYCSDDCRISAISKNSWQEKVCIGCGEIYKTQNNSQKFCSLKCFTKDKINKIKKGRKQYKCKKCGKLFYRKKRGPNDYLVYCSRECAGVGKIGSPKTKKNPFNGSSYTRAKYYGVKHERINTDKVFNFFGWRCNICGKRTPSNKRGSKASNAPEIDHITPLSLGGDHTYNNVQCACRSCNSKKSNNNSIGQLSLFGIQQNGYLNTKAKGDL